MKKCDIYGFAMDSLLALIALANIHICMCINIVTSSVPYTDFYVFYMLSLL